MSSPLEKLQESVDAACKALEDGARIINTLEGQCAYYRRHYEEAKKRTAYPEFCKHPGRCAGTGRCQADWVCND